MSRSPAMNHNLSPTMDESINGGIEINVTRPQTNGYLKDVDTDLSARLRPTNDDIPLRPKLSFKTKLFYSVGHVYNDLTVSIWFSYTLLYFKFQFNDSLAGALILIGYDLDLINLAKYSLEAIPMICYS